MSDQLKSINQPAEREVGFELLRIFSMLFIIFNHIYLFGGILSLDLNFLNQVFIKVFDGIFLTSVNVFVLIAGYFLSTQKFRFKRIFKLWMQVVYYSFFCFILAKYILKVNNFEFIADPLIKLFIPVINESHWFVSAYILVMFASPLLNMIIEKIEKKQAIIFFVGVVVLCILNENFNIRDRMGFNMGYSFIWFLILYLLGGMLKKFNPQVNKVICFFAYAFCLTFIVLYKYFCDEVFKLNDLFQFGHYTNMLVLFNSLIVLLLFKDIKIKNKVIRKIILFLSASSFAVYLIHESPYLRVFIWIDLFKLYLLKSDKLLIIHVICTMLVIYIMCTLIDLIRRFLFKYIPKLIMYLKKKIESKKPDKTDLENKKELV